ncbi:MAG: DUF3343 domain-containing protein [Bacillota bacterium]
MPVFVVFPSTHEAMSLDRLLTQAGIGHELVPVPREISASCGFAVRLRREHEAAVRALVESRGVRTEGFHHLGSDA